MDYVQKHERHWGNTSYKGRPDLAALLQGPVVIFWKLNKEKRPIATVHKDMDAISDYFARLLFRSTANPPDKQVLRIFENQKPMRITRVNVEFAPLDELP